MEEACLENNILDIWNYDEKIISQLTVDDILTAINTIERSNLTRVQYKNLLGQVVCFPYMKKWYWCKFDFVFYNLAPV